MTIRQSGDSGSSINASADLAEASPAQVLQGIHVGPYPEYAYCTGCGAGLREGMAVGCYAYRCAERRLWDVPGVYCERCAPATITTPTLGTSEVLVTAVLASMSLPDERTHRLCLGAVDIVAQSPPQEGGQP